MSGQRIDGAAWRDVSLRVDIGRDDVPHRHVMTWMVSTVDPDAALTDSQRVALDSACGGIDTISLDLGEVDARLAARDEAQAWLERHGIPSLLVQWHGDMP